MLGAIMQIALLAFVSMGAWIYFFLLFSFPEGVIGTLKFDPGHQRQFSPLAFFLLLFLCFDFVTILFCADIYKERHK